MEQVKVRYFGGHWESNPVAFRRKVDFFTSIVSLRKLSDNLSTPVYSVAKRRQLLWRTISLLINTTNAKNTLCEVIFFVLASSRVISGIIYRTSLVIIEK